MTFAQKQFERGIREYAQKVLSEAEESRKQDRRRQLRNNIKEVLAESEAKPGDLLRELAESLLKSEYWHGRAIETVDQKILHERDCHAIDQALAHYVLIIQEGDGAE